MTSLLVAAVFAVLAAQGFFPRRSGPFAWRMYTNVGVLVDSGLEVDDGRALEIGDHRENGARWIVIGDVVQIVERSVNAGAPVRGTVTILEGFERTTYRVGVADEVEVASAR